MFLLAVTAALVATTALQLSAMQTDDEAVELRLDALAIASAGRNEIRVLHAGGSSLEASALRALVVVDGAVWFDDSLPGPPVKWELGDARTIGPLTGVLPVGARVEVTLTDRVAGEVLTEFTTRAASPTAPSVPDATGFTVDLLLDGTSDVIVEPPTGIVIEAAVSHPQGRKFIRIVYADFSGFDGIAWQGLRDDGSGGDRVAGDGIYAGTALVPVNATSGSVIVTVGAVDFNGTKTADTGSIQLLVRNEATERTLNPNGAPAPGNLTCPSGIGAIRRVEYSLNGQTLVPQLAGYVHQGDHVEALVTLADGCTNIQVTFASYGAPGPSFSWDGARSQSLYDVDTRTITTGQALFQVDVPLCYFTIDLARGPAITTFGSPTSDVYYSRQGRLIDTDSGGLTAC